MIHFIEIVYDTYNDTTYIILCLYFIVLKSLHFFPYFFFFK